MKKYYHFLFLLVLISLFAMSFTLLIVAGEFKQIVSIFWGSSLIASLIYLFVFWKKIKHIVRMKFFQHLVSNLVGITLIFFIFAMINYLVARNDHVFDFTKTKIHSLSDQSKRILNQLGDNQLRLTLFAKREDWGRYLNLLDLYAKESSSVELKAINVDQEPALVALNGIKDNGTLLVEYKGKKYKNVIKDELGVTNLLMRVLKPKGLKIYYTKGHNELDFSNKDTDGLSFLKQSIEAANYQLLAIDMTQKVPSDAAALLILNPVIDFLETELKSLDEYLKMGGSAFFVLSPRFNSVGASAVHSFIDSLGVSFINGIVLDRLAATQGGQASMPIINNYSIEHEITRKFNDRTLFPVSGFFQIRNKDLYKWTTLVESTPFPASWGEINFEEVKTGKASFHEKTDYKGPLKMMLAGSYDESRIILLSSASFITNQFQGQSSNFNLFLNALSWTIKDEGLVSLNRPELAGNLIYISDMHLSMIFYFVIICFPFLFFGIAIFLYRVKLGR